MLVKINDPSFLSQQMRTLREALADWQDADIASYYLAAALGLINDPDPWGGRKDIFWTNNPISIGLYDQLRQLAVIGVLEFDEETKRFRWISAFSLP